MTHMTLITGAERRRRWSSDERQRILAAAGAPGAVVAEIARRSDVSTSLIYRWRREELEAARGSGFSPVMLKDEACSSPPKSETAMITVELGGALVRIGASAPAALVVAALKALRP